MLSKRYSKFYYSTFVVFGISFIANFATQFLFANAAINGEGNDSQFDLLGVIMSVFFWLGAMSLLTIIILSIYNLFSSRSDRTLKIISIVILSLIVLIALLFFLLSQIKFGKIGG